MYYAEAQVMMLYVLSAGRVQHFGGLRTCHWACARTRTWVGRGQEGGLQDWQENTACASGARLSILTLWCCTQLHLSGRRKTAPHSASSGSRNARRRCRLLSFVMCGKSQGQSSRGRSRREREGRGVGNR